MRTTALRWTVLAVVAIACAAVAAETAGAGAARAAFKSLKEVESARPPHVSGTMEAERENLKAEEAWRAKYVDAQAKFHAAFAQSDWANWPPSAEDADLLENGLLDIGESALAKDDGATAVKALDRAAALPKPSAPGARRIRDGRTAAHLANHDVDKARELAAAAVKSASKEEMPAALMRQGDLACALGDETQARKLYGEAAASAPEDADMTFGLDAVAGLQAKWKLDLLGKPLGDLPPEWSLGSTEDPKTATHRPSILVFPDPFQPARFDVPRLGRIAAKGVVVTGVLTPVMLLCDGEMTMAMPTDSFPRLRGEPQPDGLRGWAERLLRMSHADIRLIGVPSSKLPLGKAVLGSAILCDAQGEILYFAAPGEPPPYLAAAVERALAPK